jgi:hypothetical protein
MEPEEFLKERCEILEEEIREMKKDCRETHAEVSRDMAKTVESIHVLAREVNGKMTKVHESIGDLKVGIEQNSNKQKWYVITVLVSIIILLLTSIGNFVYNREEVSKRVNLDAQKFQKLDSGLEKQLSDFLEVQKEAQKHERDKEKK